jgi:NADH-quinone oxidoreductase subunit H
MQALLHGLMQFARMNAGPLVFAVALVAVLPLLAGYLVLLERKVMADMQVRLGPMRVGPHGLLQPIADALKLLIKEDIIPENADLLVFWVAPATSVMAAMTALAAIAFGPGLQVARDINVGILFVVGVSSLGLFGIVLGGWASNSHYSLLGALRSAAQLVSYETAAGMAIVSGLLLAGTLQIRGIVQAQKDQHMWFVVYAPVAFFIYLVASIAETNRAPFDLPEAESELVAGYMTEYSGFRWALYFLSEYTNMIVVASVATTLFLGGWLRPFASVPWLGFLNYLPPALMLGVAGYCLVRVPRQPVKVQQWFLVAVAACCAIAAAALAAPLALAPAKPYLAAIHGSFWFMLKVSAYIYLFLWLRFTLPRYRFDQLMRLGWQFLIPVSIVNVLAVAVALTLGLADKWRLRAALGATTLVTVLIAAYLVRVGGRKAPAREPAAAGKA